MIQSMTGFGSSENKAFAVEIRSLNHRFIDMTVKLPQFMNRHEITLRNTLKETFQRGRFDVSVSLTGGEKGRLTVNRELARSLYAAWQDLQEELSLPGEIRIETLAGYRELLVEEVPECDVEALHGAFREAVSNLERMRIREGGFLSEDVRKRIAVLGELNERIKTTAPAEVAGWREKLTDRMRLVLGSCSLDDNRIMQEAALIADKIDISEEISRIENHLKQFVDILDTGGVVGKKLDFLLQEINREVNTLACKSGHCTIAELVVDMKTEIEKIREQVQNMQ